MLQDCLLFVMSIDKQLLAFVSSYGYWTYGLLFLIIFCETGLIVTPFLPGDSLLFVAGNIAAQPQSFIELKMLLLLLIMASWMGNQVNYQVGLFLGPRVFKFKQSRFFNPQHLIHAHAFYQKHGKQTLILARFVPIIRTFAPFVAGVAGMNLWLYMIYNLLSALLWIGLMIASGYFLGSIAFIQAHFSLMIYAIIVLSLCPSLLMLLKPRQRVNSGPQ